MTWVFFCLVLTPLDLGFARRRRGHLTTHTYIRQTHIRQCIRQTIRQAHNRQDNLAGLNYINTSHTSTHINTSHTSHTLHTHDTIDDRQMIDEQDIIKHIMNCLIRYVPCILDVYQMLYRLNDIPYVVQMLYRLNDVIQIRCIR